ncbi:hypothetical protein FHR24_002304 [Wenyingzhuangia heitensis]|uniref:DUF5703 domain-containing protein n=1 Tax=Wenyingzhuangia heitensis TaxID=1487859 RepID=A0ABX0UAT1_9FLAO|nr:DUF5703 domain-containing protein [Wenyingzhuangia heitensis]NIJ45833.1 hypothetical protein [Wenyingzhuangia heitensis]
MNILKNVIYYVTFLLFSFSAFAQNKQIDWLDEYNVVWNSQSKNSSESMPCGGGDLGMNVWVESGDLLFYIDRSGNLDENDQLRKNGRVRIKMDPSPFSNNGSDVEFEQTLDLKTGSIIIKGKTPENTVNIRIWTEVLKPVIHVDMDSDKASRISATFESWRNEKLPIPISGGGGSRFACWGYAKYKGDVFAYPDKIFHEDKNKVVFYHQNGDDRIFDKSVKLQKLSSVKDQFNHPTKNRIFGGVMYGDNLKQSEGTEGIYAGTPYKGWQLESLKKSKKHTIKIALHTEQIESDKTWKENLYKTVDNPSKNAWKKSVKWWENFWDRSHIVINKGKGENDLGWRIGRNYQLMRYVLGCNPYGELPNHFSGGFFQFDPVYIQKEKNTTPSYFNADYRKWGAWTGMNQRLIHWSFLKSGDFEELRPQFNYFKNNFINAKLRSEVTWGVEGCAFGEQIGTGGLPLGQAYSWEMPLGKRKPTDEIGTTGRHTYYYHSQIEFAYMLHEWYRFTGADISEYIPFMKGVVVFEFEYQKMLQKKRNGKEWGPDGKLVMHNMPATESYHHGDNPAPNVAGLHKNLEALISLPDKWVSKVEKEKFKDWNQRVPDLEHRTRNGHKTIAPYKEGNFRWGNREIPQLYPVFPYGIYAVGQPDLEVGINTWKYGLDKSVIKYVLKPFRQKGMKGDIYAQKEEWWGWGQQAMFLARLGLTDEAKEYVSKKLDDAQGDPWKEAKPSRFPVFYGPGYGCMPDLEWGTSGMISLQEMCLQTISNDGKDLTVLPTWPKDWDVDFKLHAPQKTIVEAKQINSKVKDVAVTPSSRIKDIVYKKE